MRSHGHWLLALPIVRRQERCGTVYYRTDTVSMICKLSELYVSYNGERAASQTRGASLSLNRNVEGTVVHVFGTVGRRVRRVRVAHGDGVICCSEDAVRMIADPSLCRKS